MSARRGSEVLLVLEMDTICSRGGLEISMAVQLMHDVIAAGWRTCMFPAHVDHCCYLLLTRGLSLEVGVMENWVHGEVFRVASGLGPGDVCQSTGSQPSASRLVILFCYRLSLWNSRETTAWRAGAPPLRTNERNITRLMKILCVESLLGLG